MYRCARCKQFLPASTFRPNLIMKSGIHSWCKPCTIARTRQWRADNRERCRQRGREQYGANLWREREMAMARYLRRHTASYDRTCPTCHVDFTTRRSRKVYCSDQCRQLGKYRTNPGVNWHTRKRILDRDDWRCYLCGRDIDRAHAWPHPLSGTVDHVMPRSAGGSNDDFNLRAAHWHCNEAKADKIPGVDVWVPAEAA